MSGNLARHWSVLRAAWALDAESQRTRRRHLETEFLPPALEVIETPASPLGRTVLWVLIALLAVAALWAWFGRLDVVAVAPGRVVPAERVKTVQASELAVVRTLLVQEGQAVTAGQTLLELDATEADASDAQARRGLQAAGVDRARANAFKAYLDHGTARWALPATTPLHTAAVQQRLVAARIEEHESAVSALQRQRAERQAEYDAARTEQAKLRETLVLLDEQLRGRRELVATGFMSGAQLYEMEERRIERSRTIEVQGASATRAAAAMASLDQLMRQQRAEFAGRAAREMAEAEDNLALRQEEVAKTGRRAHLQTLTAPVAGVVQGLALHTVGAVVEPAQELMKIVPNAGPQAANRLVVEALVSNKDVGSIRVGQRVRVKVDAFPFTRHGVLEGRVEHIGADAVQQEQSGLVFVVRVGLVTAAVQGVGVAPGLSTALRVSPGYTVQAEIHTGRRRIVEYIWSPISVRLDEAGREP